MAVIETPHGQHLPWLHDGWTSRDPRPISTAQINLVRAASDDFQGWCVALDLVRGSMDTPPVAVTRAWAPITYTAPEPIRLRHDMGRRPNERTDGGSAPADSSPGGQRAHPCKRNRRYDWSDAELARQAPDDWFGKVAGSRANAPLNSLGRALGDHLTETTTAAPPSASGGPAPVDTPPPSSVDGRAPHPFWQQSPAEWSTGLLSVVLALVIGFAIGSLLHRLIARPLIDWAL